MLPIQLSSSCLRCTLALFLLLYSCRSTSNKTTQTFEQLGHSLFFDTRLSFNQTKSCSSCHDPKFAFSDSYRRSITATGEVVAHNAPSLINISRHRFFDWANPAIRSLYQQSDRPLLNTHPTELGMSGHEDEILARLAADNYYSEAFNNVFKDSATPISLHHIKLALVAYVNTLQSIEAPYDRYINGDSIALSASAQRGRALFFSQRLRCASCHPPPYFTTATLTNRVDSIYFNTGLYSSDSERLFKTPSLRNLSLTAPYGHDGSVNTLDDMIDIYARGGRLIANGPRTGDGRTNPNRSPLLTGFSISPSEKRDLVDFLFSLTDSTIFHKPSFQYPTRQSGK